MKPPDRGWVIFVLLIAWAFWMVNCGRTWAHANTRQGYEHGMRMCVENIQELAAYKDAYSRGDSTAVPLTDSTGNVTWVWHKKTGWKHWTDSIPKVGLP